MRSAADPTRYRALTLVFVSVIAVLLVVAFLPGLTAAPATPSPSAAAADVSTPPASASASPSPEATTDAAASPSTAEPPPSPGATDEPAQSPSPRPRARAWTRLPAAESGARWGYMYEPALWDFDDALFLNPYPNEGDELWRSSDGLTWSRADVPGLVQDEDTGDFVSLTSVAHGSGGYVAVGTLSNSDTQTFEGRVWTSRDGIAWNGQAPEGVAGTTEGVTGSAELTLVGAADDGYLAFGSGPDGRMAWTSADGMRWQPATDPSLKKIARTVVGLVPIDGRLVAFTTPARERKPPITVHTGSALGPWRQVATLNARGGYGLAAQARPGAPLTVIARTKADHLGLWTSLDGSTWKRAGTLPAVLATSAIPLPTGWLAIGGLDVSTGCASAGPTIGLTWTSPDGRTWKRLRDDRSGVISALARRGDTLIGLGVRTATTLNRPGAVWTMHVDAPPSASAGKPTRVPDNVGCGP